MLERAALAEVFASADPLVVNDDFRDLVLSGDATHRDIFSFCLEQSHYNILLFDHSFFQFSWQPCGDVRYAFCPNPHVSHPLAVQNFRKYRQLLSDGYIDSEEFVGLANSLGARGNIPMFRFELSRGQYVKLSHPCAHLHIGVHSENRWAVSRALTPLAFTMLMVKHYYPGEWSLGSEGQSDGASNLFEEELRTARADCYLLDPEQFDEDEALSFHFA